MTIDLAYVQEILILVLKGIPTTLRLTLSPCCSRCRSLS